MGFPEGRDHVNGLEQRFVRVEAGSFWMGMEGNLLPDAVSGKTMRCGGDYDEHPAHEVTLSRPFWMAVVPVTNREYEMFEPGHRAMRGQPGDPREGRLAPCPGLSQGDDEAVVHVSWHEAMAFCRWLSEREGMPYRLPTEAEWEYACRAGTSTPYHTGELLPEEYGVNARRSRFPAVGRTVDEDLAPMLVGQTPPNSWGLCDMHGVVEEWCLDWYGPYEAGPQRDPVGREVGDFRVTRGGSHSSEVYYLRSSNRMGALPEDKHWLIGMRLVIGEDVEGAPVPVGGAPRCQCEVVQEAAARARVETPYSEGPKAYVRIPPDSSGPVFSGHNHDPALAACGNGDLLAVWYSCMNEEESDRELSQVASRLRKGAAEWEEASEFWNAPDRNNHGPALWCAEDGRLYHFAGMSAAASWSNLAIVMRTSEDHGASWSKARLIVPEHGAGHVPAESVFRTREGEIVLPYDTRGGTGLLKSADEGVTWADPGGTIAGIHAGVVQLADGRLMAFGRGGNIDGRLPCSLSEDGGASWQYSASPFPPIQGGQRLVLKRLQEGPLLMASFSNNGGMVWPDAEGKERPVYGLFAAVSFDEGGSWPVRRLITAGGPGQWVATTTNRPRFWMDAGHAEPLGYLAACQSEDGVIHLITSRNHYAFNLAWLQDGGGRC